MSEKDAKKGGRSIRVEDPLFQVALEMMKAHQTDNFSDYVRGLIISDAFRHRPSAIIGISVPGWVVGKLIEFGVPEGPPLKKALPQSGARSRARVTANDCTLKEPLAPE